MDHNLNYEFKKVEKALMDRVAKNRRDYNYLYKGHNMVVDFGKFLKEPNPPDDMVDFVCQVVADTFMININHFLASPMNTIKINKYVCGEVKAEEVFIATKVGKICPILHLRTTSIDNQRLERRINKDYDILNSSEVTSSQGVSDTTDVLSSHDDETIEESDKAEDLDCTIVAAYESADTFDGTKPGPFYSAYFGSGKPFPIHLFKDCPVEEVARIPGNIDGMKVYKMSTSGVQRLSKLTYDHRYFTSSGSSSKSNIKKRTARCQGGYACPNEKCVKLVCSFSKIPNKTKFQFIEGVRCCFSCSTPAIREPCGAYKVTMFYQEKEEMWCYHLGKHTCTPKVMSSLVLPSEEEEAEVQRNR